MRRESDDRQNQRKKYRIKDCGNRDAHNKRNITGHGSTYVCGERRLKRKGSRARHRRRTCQHVSDRNLRRAALCSHRGVWPTGKNPQNVADRRHNRHGSLCGGYPI